MSVEGWNIPFKKHRAYFNRAYHYIRIYFFAINSIFRLPKDCFSKYHRIYFAGSDLELIIHILNEMNEVAVIFRSNYRKRRYRRRHFWPMRTFCLKKILSRYFQELYLRAVRSRNSRVKKFSTIRIVMTPDKTYVDFMLNWHLR